jgi:beta-glucosidase-like glycosyl hydrolase/CubicO group peptidase (beta-lactamase class C family)
MKKPIFFLLVTALLGLRSAAQQDQEAAANRWADSVFLSLSDDQRIAQLMVLRLSGIDPVKKTPVYFDSLAEALVKEYNIGAVCLFQGSPYRQATILNRLQALAQTPVMVCIDGEWGLGMRMTDTVMNLPKQMMLGAVNDTSLVYRYGRLVAAQCKRMGIHVNYAPVADVNNNSDNPVINDRSFGENKYVVAEYAYQYMKGMQDEGVMACAKHFPGHGDVAVDSHLDLPVINKSRAQLDSLELYPFRRLFSAGVGSVMVAHLYIPSIDKRSNRATSLSDKAINGLMRDELGYSGLTFTDALEMQGVNKFFPEGQSSVESLIAGNDMLCLPGDVPKSIAAIKAAIVQKRLSWDDVYGHCRKVLRAKYNYVLNHVQPISTEQITRDLNAGIADLRKEIARKALTVLALTDERPLDFSPADSLSGAPVYVGVGAGGDNAFSLRLRKNFGVRPYFFDYKQSTAAADSVFRAATAEGRKIIIGVHGYNRAPANNFGISKPAFELVRRLQQNNRAVTFVFGNPYAVKNFCGATNLVVCYEDDSLTQGVAADFIERRFTASGHLPVTVCDKYPSGSGITTALIRMPSAVPESLGLNPFPLQRIDSIAQAAIEKAATPGCVVLVLKDGKIAYYKAFGHTRYDAKQPVDLDMVYDMASVTKICATTLSVMRLYEEGRLNLDRTIGDYLPWTRGSNKASLTLKKLLLHQGGLVPFISFYKEVIDADCNPRTGCVATICDSLYCTRVADGVFLRRDWQDTMMRRLLESPVSREEKYVYSDNDFIFLGLVAEAVTGQTLDAYVQQKFYRPMGLTTIGFNPRRYVPLGKIVPTEDEACFRRQLLQGDVHDPGAAMFGGVAGHAGLFSSALDIAALMQMLLDRGLYNGRRYLQPETVQLFTAYQSGISRRGLGFDKPEKDNASRKEPYPAAAVPSSAFGHTGFTGTCTWADPENRLVYVFLSNRVTPDGGANNRLSKLNIRSSIHDAIYESLRKSSARPS